MKKFSEYIKLFRGSSPRPIVNFVTKDKNGVNWIKIGDTKNANNSIINNVEEKITIEGARKSRKVTSGELILANSMSFGKVYQLSIDGCIYDGWFVLREYENYFEKSFLLQLLNSDYLQKQYKRLSAGGIVQNISSEIVYETILIRPSFQEQQKISSFLSLIDERIQTQIKIIEQLETLIKGLSEKLFSQEIRFKGFTEKWTEKKLGKLATFYSGGTPLTSKKEYFDGNIPFIRSGEINSNVTEQFINELGLKNSSAKMVEVGDILYALYGATSGEVAISKINGAINQAVLCIKSQQNHYFIYSYLFHKKEHIINKYLQGGQGNLSADIVKQIELPIPPLEEQTIIANFLSAIDTKIQTEKNILEKYQSQKQYLLQNLFI